MQTHFLWWPFLSLIQPSFKRKKIQKQAEESTPSPTLLDYISTCAEESSATEQTRITVVGCVIITKCSFTITVSPSRGYGFQTSAPISVIKGLPMLFSELGSWLNSSQCSQISNTNGMPRKTQTKAFNQAPW